MHRFRRWPRTAAAFLIFAGQASTAGCTGADGQGAAGAAPAQAAPAEAPAAAQAASAPVAAEVPGPGVPTPGKYGCTASRYSASSGTFEYDMKGSITLATDGTYRYLGFEEPSPGRYTADPATGKINFRGGYLDGGEATPVEDRPDKYYLVAPAISENRWTCGLAAEG